MSSHRFENSPRRERRSGTFSLSAAFRTSPKRASVIDPLLSPEIPDSQPSCLERIHYPVFDPQNPLHNPDIRSSSSPSGRRQEFQVSSSDSQRQGSWFEQLPRRSIHKARSGLLAIRASLLRLSSRESSDLNDDSAIDAIPKEIAKHEQGRIYGQGLSSSTQEDLDFGIRLYRTTSSPWAPAQALDGANADSLIRSESPLPLVNSISAPADLETHHYSSDDPEPMNEQAMSVKSEEPPSYCSIEESAQYYRRSKSSTAKENANEEVDASTVESHCYFSHSSHSADLNELGSPASSFRFEDMIPRQKNSSSPGVSRTTSMVSSVPGSLTETMQSETFISQEYLPPRSHEPQLDPRETDRLGSAPNRSSDVVTFAFPGIYQALLDQWAIESGNKTRAPCFPEAPTGEPQYLHQACHGGDPGPEPSKKRHSFGVHMSLRTASDQLVPERPHTVYGSSQLLQVFTAQSCEPPTPTDSRDSSSPSVWDRTVESLYDGSDYSNYPFPGSSPTDITSPSYYSNDIWSPLDSPIDEELLFSPFPRNEYYMTDGKTSSFYPDQDDQHVKVGGPFLGDGRIHSGRGLDRTRSDRLREITERIPTMVLSPLAQSNPPVGREASESTDESVVIRHVGNRNAQANK